MLFYSLLHNVLKLKKEYKTCMTILAYNALELLRTKQKAFLKYVYELLSQ